MNRINTGNLRDQWKEYHKAYEEMLERTSTDHAPWYVIPADHKPFARVAVGDIIIDHFKKLDMRYPQPESDEMLAAARARLLTED